VVATGALALAAVAAAPTEPPVGQLADLAFLQGTWRVEQNGVVTEETWIPPAGGTMLGVGRTIRGERTVFFEFLRLEQRDDGVFYIAAPRGQGATEFKLTVADIAAGRFVFENPSHDFPQQISYERQPDGQSVRASISGLRRGQPATESWEYRRAR
jgi:hypothetical protein